MSGTLFSLKLSERFKITSALTEVSRWYGSPSKSRSGMNEAVRILELKTQQVPNEWCYWYVLSNYRLSLKDHIGAIRAAENCRRIRPEDARSKYALAIVWRDLTNARNLGSERPQLANDYLELTNEVYRVDPQACQTALDTLGVSVNEVAERSVTLFEEILAMKINKEERKEIESSITLINTNFPRLRDQKEHLTVSDRPLTLEEEQRQVAEEFVRLIDEKLEREKQNGNLKNT